MQIFMNFKHITNALINAKNPPPQNKFVVEDQKRRNDGYFHCRRTTYLVLFRS